MALVPGRQFCPTTTTFIDSLHSSLSGTRLQFFRSSWIDKWNEPHQQNRPKRPRPVLNYRCSKNLPGSVYATSDNSSDNSGVSNSSGSTMEKIMERLKKVGYSDEVNERKDRVPERVVEKGSIEDIFYVEEGMLPNTRGGFSEKSLLGLENVSGTDGKVLFPWEKPKEEEKEKSLRKKRKTYLAELTLPAPELNRLRYLGFHTKSKTRIGGAGVTHAIVDAIHEKWKVSEIVRLRFEGSSALNMKRMHEILERKTGGLVIWRSGTSVILYRGSSYDVPTVQPNKQACSQNGVPRSSIPTATDKTSRGSTEHNSYSDVQASPKNLETTVENKKETDLVPEVRYEDEIDKLLDSLGPRYTDWPGDGPLPVDADLLPATIPGYEPPFRILPYGVRCNLGLKEATALRRISRPLPPHFALGRSRQLQGLAVAMTKLWERTLIAKVALKRNVQLTTGERMAENIKKLTGGILLSRNKDFLVFYRGKSFLSKEVAEALLERERLAKTLQDDEEQARLRASATVEPNIGVVDQAATAGTLGETVDLDARWGKKLDDNDKENMMREIELERHAKLVRKLEGKLAFAERKLDKAEHALSKVEVFLKPTEQQADPESITDEERFMFRKLGLRMKAFLLLGRRGVFDGTVENMHLHWKYRELVKILLKAKSFDLVRKIALSLEAESGGVLVSVDRVSKGYAIIVFRGKDYQRPSAIRPKNLLTKRKALARSIELQRREALLKHIAALERRVEKLRAEIEQVEIVEGQGDGQLYDRLDSTYPTDDEESEEEGDEAYLGAYGDGNEDEDENDGSIRNLSKFEDDEESEADEDEAYLESYGDRSEHEDESNDSTQNLSKLEDESNDINHNVHLVTNSAYDIQNQAVHP